MFSNKRRSPTLVDVCDFNTLYIREHNANINTKNYLSSKSPVSPILSRNLRLVVTNGIPSNILILPKTLSPSRKSEKKEAKKNSKQPSFDVYRSLRRSSLNSERDIINDDVNHLNHTFTVDRISPLYNTGFFRPNNLPRIPKQNINSNENQKSTNTIKTISERIEYIRSSPSKTFHRTTPTSEYYEEEKDEITTTTTTTKVLSCVPKDQTRKQLHVYMPAINC